MSVVALLPERLLLHILELQPQSLLQSRCFTTLGSPNSSLSSRNPEQVRRPSPSGLAREIFLQSDISLIQLLINNLAYD